MVSEHDFIIAKVDYRLHETQQDSILSGNKSHIESIAKFFVDLVENEETWDQWESKMPVIQDTEQNTQRRSSQK